MQHTLTRLTILLLAAWSMHCAAAGEPAAETTAYRLQGRIVDAGGQPLAAARVGLRAAGAATTTDGQGQFLLSFRWHYAPPRDKNKPYDALEIDLEGCLGQTVEIRDLAFFDKPLAARLAPNPLTADWAEYSRRMSMGFNFPPGLPHVPKDFSLIDDAEWQRTFAAIDAASKNGPTEQAFFQAYVPKQAAKLKALFLITRHGMGVIDHPLLRAFADREHIALVSVLGNPLQRGFYPVSVIDEDLRRLGQLLQHPELPQLPYLTFGHSNGTGFACILAAQRPERAIGWISYHSGGAFHLQFPGIEKVPGLAMHGNIDPFSHNGQEQTIANLRKIRHAPLALMMEGNVAHGAVDAGRNATWGFVIAFCEAAMRIRLNADGTLRPVVLEQGWLGANYDRSRGGQQELTIAPYAAYQGDRAIANWLPDQQFAETWQRYGMTDPRPHKDATKH